MENASRDPPDRQRGGLWPSCEDIEQGVDDILLPHEDGNKDVGDDSVSNLPGGRLVCRSESDEDRHVGREGDAEKSTVDREEHVAQVANRLDMPLLDVLIFQVTFPVETILLGSEVIG